MGKKYRVKGVIAIYENIETEFEDDGKNTLEEQCQTALYGELGLLVGITPSRIMQKHFEEVV